MGSFHKTIKLSQLSNNTMKQVKINGQPVAVYNVDGKIYATSDTCTHEECNLSDGFLNEKIVECPCHGGRFDVTTGEVKALPPTVPVRTFRTRVVGDDIEVELC